MKLSAFVIVCSAVSVAFGAAIPHKAGLAKRCKHRTSSATATATDVASTSDSVILTVGTPTATKITTEPTETSDSESSTSKSTSTATHSSSTPTSTSSSDDFPTNGWPFNTNSNSAKSAFGVSGNFKASYLDTIEGSAGLVANYPKGSYAGSDNPGIAGFIFEASGNADVENAKEAKMTYQVKFPKGFDFVLAGKLPGLYGGDDDEVAKTCAGGNHDDRCWSARIMWREDGKGELYAYLPTANQKLSVCKGKCDVKYGASIGTGTWDFPTGEWTQVEEHVKLNDVGKANGEIQVIVNGETKVDVKNLTLRSSDKGRIRGGMIHTFFGGSSTPAYQSPKDQQAFFKDFAIEVVDKL